MGVKLRSDAFANGEAIPRRYTEDGEDLSPPLSWSGVSDDTREIALLVDDPDAPRAEPWVHWVIYKVPADVRALFRDEPARERRKTMSTAIGSGPGVAERDAVTTDELTALEARAYAEAYDVDPPGLADWSWSDGEA